MSATMDPKPLLSYLHRATLIEVPGLTFPVEVFYDQQSQLLNTNPIFIDRVVNKIVETCETPHHDEADARHTLVFLPGMSEIQRVHKNLMLHSRWPSKNRKLFILHGSLSLKEQHAVLHSPEPKVILATNVAETVVEYANKIEADLILIMNKPSLGIGSFFGGTETQKIVDISNIPVMTVQPIKRVSVTHFGKGF